MSGDLDARLMAQAGVKRAAAVQPGRFRRCSSIFLLATLSAGALAPLVVAGSQGLAAALAGVTGNVGSGLLAAVVDRGVARWRDGKKAADPDALRDVLASDLLAELQRGNPAAQELQAGLTDLLWQLGGVEAAIEATAGEVREHVAACFDELLSQQHLALEKLRTIDRSQRRQERQLRDQGRQIEEMADRLRLFTRWLNERLAPMPAPPPAGLPPAVPVIVPATAAATAVDGWNPGAEIAIGDRAYLLHGDLLEERLCADHTVLRRQARGLQLVPACRPGQEYVWLCQVEIRQPTPASRAALAVLSAQRDLLMRLGRVAGLPRVRHLEGRERIATLILGWPASRPARGPCQTLQAMAGPSRPDMDSWRMFRLCTGLAGLCDTLASLHDVGAAHRYLTPSSIVTADQGRLALRDAGLATRDCEPDEGPADYQAPEQRGGRGLPGPPTDVYQLAAVTYHFVAGHPPHPRVPLPLRTQARELPGRLSDGLAAALAPDPGQRLDIRSLAAVFRATCEDLS
jgi:hypothetical protein